MKVVTGRIPLAGVYHFNMSVPDDWTDKQIFKKLEDDFNNLTQNTKLLAVMQSGDGVNYPLSFAVVYTVLI